MTASTKKDTAKKTKSASESTPWNTENTGKTKLQETELPRNQHNNSQHFSRILNICDKLINSNAHERYELPDSTYHCISNNSCKQVKLSPK